MHPMDWKTQCDFNEQFVIYNIYDYTIILYYYIAVSATFRPTSVKNIFFAQIYCLLFILL